MLTFLPAILLFITALVVFFLRYLPKGTGYAWLVSAVMVLLIWGGVLAYHWVHPEAVDITPGGRMKRKPPMGFGFMGFDLVLYSFTVVSICLRTVFLPGQNPIRSNPLSWAGTCW